MSDRSEKGRKYLICLCFIPTTTPPSVSLYHPGVACEGLCLPMTRPSPRCASFPRPTTSSAPPRIGLPRAPAPCALFEDGSDAINHSKKLLHTEYPYASRHIRLLHALRALLARSLVKYWDGDRFEEIESLEGHRQEVTSLAITSDGGSYLRLRPLLPPSLLTCLPTCMKLLSHSSPLLRSPHPPSPPSPTFSSWVRTASVISASMDRSVRVWARTDEQLFAGEERERRTEEALDEQAVVYHQDVRTLSPPSSPTYVLALLTAVILLISALPCG